MDKYTNNNPHLIEKVSYYVEALINQDYRCDSYEEWQNRAFELAELGEDGREFFHLLSMSSSKYDYQSCERKFDNAIETRSVRGLRSFFWFCINTRNIKAFKTSLHAKRRS
jgi:hypothetical protein